MSKHEDGGPAFPGPQRWSWSSSAGMARPDDWDYDREGMTLLDWFAGQAIPKVMEYHHGDWVAIAATAYKLADAMIAEKKARASTSIHSLDDYDSP